MKWKVKTQIVHCKSKKKKISGDNFKTKILDKVDVKYNLARYKEPRNLAFHLKPLNGPLTINKRSQTQCAYRPLYHLYVLYIFKAFCEPFAHTHTLTYIIFKRKSHLQLSVSVCSLLRIVIALSNANIVFDSCNNQAYILQHSISLNSIIVFYLII